MSRSQSEGGLRLVLLAISTSIGIQTVVTAHAAEMRAAHTDVQNYPSRPVRFIVPFPPSGGTDIIGRVIAQKLGEALGQTFVIDNRGGAASTLGSAIAAKSPADGNTILLATATYAISASFYRQLQYDPINGFDAVAKVASGPLLLVTNPSLAARSAKELIAYAKTNPDKINYASGGEGGINHLAAEMLKSLTGIRMLHVPYKGAGPAITGLLGGEVQLMIATLSSSIGQVRAGKLRALAVASAQRTPLLLEAPTLAESGVPGYAADNWYGLLVPRGTPERIIRKLNEHIVEMVRAQDVRERFAALGFAPASSTPGEFGAYINAEIAKWARAMHDAGMRPK